MNYRHMFMNSLRAPIVHSVDFVNSSTAATFERDYSPITLGYEWPKINRLLFMIICSCLGSTMNGFFVAAFFVEHTLKKIGNTFLACIGLADLMITTGVMPVSAVVLLSGQWDTYPVCQALQFIATASTYCYSLFFMLVAFESFYKLCRTRAEYNMFISMRVSLVTVIIFGTSFLLAGAGVYLGLDYDYCERIHKGNMYFRMITAGVFHAIPCIAIISCLITAILRVKRRAKEQIFYMRSEQYLRDKSMNNLNLTAYLIFAIGWIPYIVIIHKYPDTTDGKFYNSVWVAMCRSVITSFLYGTVNRCFRRAFAHLFNYCCCKSTLSGSLATRNRRALEFKPGTGDVRVHIMHQAVNMASPLRGASTSRETQDL